MSTHDNGDPMPEHWLVEARTSPFGPRRREATAEQWAAYAAEFKAEADRMADVIFESAQHHAWVRGTDVALADTELDGIGTE